MLRLAQSTLCLLCAASMALTGLFSLSFTGVSIDNTDQSIEAKAVFIALLFLTIGCCIDIGKYLFWSQRKRGKSYAFISLGLTFFSLSASYAFFISSELTALKDVQPTTTEYIAAEHKVDSIKREILDNEALLANRLQSTYHQQWQEAEGNSQKIRELRGELAGQIEHMTHIGFETAQKNLPASQVFLVVSQALGVTAVTVRNFAFGLLALLLEVSTLGAISLVGVLKSENDEVKAEESLAEQTNFLINSDNEYRKKITLLSNDIIKGKVPPVLRRIRTARYGLDIDEVRTLLKNLYSTGILEVDKWKSYRLSGLYLDIHVDAEL